MKDDDYFFYSVKKVNYSRKSIINDLKLKNEIKNQKLKIKKYVSFALERIF